MALHRGIQSAIFYYVSCAPCAEARVRKRRKQDAERDRADREALELHMPGLYRQPDPSSTNPYWQVEIDAGPIPMRTRRRLAESTKATNSTKSNIASSVSVNGSGVYMERSDSAKSGLEQYQRQDEVLWGAKSPDDEIRRPLSSRQSSSNGLPRQMPRARINDSSNPRSYRHMQNAAINDLHPPTTRKVDSRDEVLWMMQPPPLPEVMNGKDSALNRSVSSVSRPSAVSRTGSTSGRHSRLGDVEVVQEDEEHIDEVRPSTLMVPENPAIPRSRTLPLRCNPDDSKNRTSTLRRPRPVAQIDASNSLSPRRSRPQLPTVISEDLVPVPRHDLPFSGPHRASSFNTGLPHQIALTRGDSEDLISSTKQTPLKWMATRTMGNRRDSLDEHGSDENTSPENFDAWQAPEFELPQWIHEHTKREVRQRWSFDM